MNQITVADAALHGMLNKIMSRKGQIVTLKTKRAVKVRKGQAPIEKESEFQCRFGVDYDKMKAVIEKRASGELPAENAGLPWGTWVVFPYVLEHKGEYYLRCSTINTPFYREPIYTRGGVVIDVAEVQAAALASEFSKSEDLDVFNIRLSSLVSVK